MPRKPKFMVRPGAKIAPEVAALVIKECESITKSGKPVVAETLLVSASRPTSALHDQFEWDDHEAANKWRMHHARRLLGCVIELDIRTQKYGRALYSIDVSSETAEPRHYLRRKVVIKNFDAMSQISGRLYREIVSRVDEAESLGMDESDRAWGRIARVVRGNFPRGAQE